MVTDASTAHPLSRPTADEQAMARSVRVWLWSMWGLVLAMVVVGGITRLTGSGLSMVEWRPLMGALPPIGEQEWFEVFAKYQQTPQFQQVNHWMTLADFKQIFVWEYLHRLLGRLIGVAFLVPWVVFLVRRTMSRRLLKLTFVAFLLGGAQGLLGWFMVASGLVDVPAVSHYRLAAHLSLAFFVGMYLAWIAMAADRPTRDPAASRKAIWAFIALLGLQIVWGAFMAGTRAGHLASTFPDMNGELVPDAVLASALPWWRDLMENPWSIHFVHRTLGWVVLLAGAVLAWRLVRHAETSGQRLVGWLVGGGIALQFVLGVLTVILHVAIPVAVLHQAGGYLLLTAVVAALASRAARGG